MRVLIPVDPFIPVPPRQYGGVERIVYGLISELRRRGVTVGLVAHRDSTVDVDAFFPWPDASPRRNVEKMRILRRAVAEFRPDVVHSYARLLHLIPLLAQGLPCIMSYGRWPTGYTVRWSRRIARGHLTFTGCSEYLAKLGRERGGGDWTAIPNFVDPTRLHFVPAVPIDAPLVFLSRVERGKGTHTAIQIALASGRRLLIAGNRESHHDTYWREEIAPHLGQNGIEYVGPVDDLAKDELLGSAAALVVPMEWDEPFGIVFAEALACGTPVISRLRGALPEIVNNGVHGFLSEEFSVLADSVQQLSRIDRAACRAQVEQHFTVGVVTSQYLDLYHRVLNTSASR